jgi:tetratricopeptide (TPR) repeat protein
MKLAQIGIAMLAGAAVLAQVRFDYLVRNDLFAGFAGNEEALKRGMATTERALAENPNHPEALVWHGAGNLFLAGREFQKGNAQKGQEMFQNAVAEMDRAVKLEPDNIGVRIPRGASVMSAARNMGDSPYSRALMESARDDFQRAFDLQEKWLDKMGVHPLGELLQGLGDIYSRLGRTEDARKYYTMIQARLKDSIYAKRAAQWMETQKPLPVAQTGCVGCHTGN